MGAASLNLFLVYFGIFPAQFLNPTAEIKSFIWPPNTSYEAALTALHFGQSNIDIVTQTILVTSTLAITALLVRVVLELALPQTVFRSYGVGLFRGMTAASLLCLWVLQFTDERGLFQLDIHLPILKNVVELNFVIFGIYYLA